MEKYTSHTSTEEALEEIRKNPRTGLKEIQLVGQYEMAGKEDGLTDELKDRLAQTWEKEIKRGLAGMGRRVLYTTIEGEELIQALSATRTLLEDFFERNGWIHIEE